MAKLNRRSFLLMSSAAIACATYPEAFRGRRLLPSVRELDFVNVMDFGADPTGERSSKEAFRKAIDALGESGGTIYLPPGSYKDVMPFPEKILISGDRRG